MIAIEGIDASGKATQSKLLAEALAGEALRIDFPHYATATGAVILAHLKSEWGADATFPERSLREQMQVMHNRSVPPTAAQFDALVLQMLFAANRLELVPTIEAAAGRGRPIIFDRYWASSAVYGRVEGLDAGWIRHLNRGLPQPALWILLDVTPDEALRRRPERRDRFESRPGFMDDVRVGYRRFFDEMVHEQRTQRGRPIHWHVVDGVGDVETVHARIRSIVEGVFGRDIWRDKEQP